MEHQRDTQRPFITLIFILGDFGPEREVALIDSMKEYNNILEGFAQYSGPSARPFINGSYANAYDLIGLIDLILLVHF